MEFIFEYLSLHADQAYVAVIILLLLGGLNLPISKDLVIISAGVIAYLYLDGNPLILYLCCYFAAVLSAWQVYWIGRWLGPKLYTTPYLRKMFTKERVELLHHYYEKFGILTFIVVRFIPCGFRNALFITSGMGKMPFFTFIRRDAFACLLATACLFSIGYYFAEYHEELIEALKQYQFIALILFLTSFTGIIYLFWKKSKLAPDIPK